MNARASERASQRPTSGTQAGEGQRAEDLAPAALDSAVAGAIEPRPTWRKRLLAPLAAQLTQGVSAEKLSATVAVGAGCSMFPFLGTTSLLNLGVGLALRMNQPVLQTLNQLLGPVHLAMILVYVRTGEWLVERFGGGVGGARFSVGEMLSAFRDLSFADFLAQFGRAGLHALLAWAVTLPLLVGAVYLVARPLIFAFARRSRAPREKTEVP
ncbi:MAG: DUF2062 domain-containing protein [Planctomycetota bacterium]